MKKVILIWFTIVFAMQINAQVTGAKFQLTYDTSSCDYLVSLHITEGQVNKLQDAYHFGFYMTLVTEGESQIEIKESYNPYLPNSNPKKPTAFLVSSFNSCLLDYGIKFYEFISVLSPASYYGLQVKTGDIIPLFRFSLTIESNQCGKGVRFWDPEIDPLESDRCMGGVSPGYSIKIGGDNNLHKGNISQSALPPVPIFLNGIQQDSILSINGNHLLSQCQLPAKYEWINETGSVLDSTLNIAINKTKPENKILYLTATDALGCKNYISYSTNDTIGYSPIDTACSGTEIVITPKTSYVDGIWTIDSNHIDGITIVQQANGQATLSISENANGSYRFFFSQGNIMEEKIITVVKRPVIVEALDVVCEKDTLVLPLQGSWKSDNAVAAEIVENTKVVAHKAGNTLLYWIDAKTGCQSNGVEFKVHKNPVVSYNGPTSICVGSAGQIWPQEGGIWESSNPSILQINNAGKFTALSPGSANLYFTSLETNCKSLIPVALNVIEKDSIWLNGKDTICIGNTTNLNSSTNYGFWITDNPSIATIDTNGLVTGWSEGTCRITKFSPISGCTSESIQVWVRSEDQCSSDSIFKLQIVAYSDVDKNNSYTPGIDFFLPNIGISLDGYAMIQYTDLVGGTLWKKAAATYQIRASAHYGNWENSTLHISWLLTKDTILYLGFLPIAGQTSAYADITSGFTRCNKYIPFKAIVKNEGSTPFTGKFVLKPDERTYMRRITPPPVEQNDSVWIWDINDLPPGLNFDITFESFIPLPEIPDDQIIYGYTLRDKSGQIVSQNQSAVLIRCSYDPNDLQVAPDRPGEENYVLRDEAIFYKIRFQNTGNDTAFYVRIDDVLDAAIDRKGLILSDASHPCKMFLCSNDTLCFIFDPIELTDSTSHFDKSHGYVVFKSRLADSIMHNTQFINQAHIVFDANKAIVTNKVKNTFVDALPCPENDLETFDDGLLASATGLIYEWINCENQEIVAITEGHFFEPETEGRYQVKIKGPFCTVISECVSFETTATIDQKADTMLIFPNPAYQYFMLQTSEFCTDFVLYDASGKELKPRYQRISNTLLKVESQHLQSGVYLLMAHTAQGIFTKSIIILKQ